MKRAAEARRYEVREMDLDGTPAYQVVSSDVRMEERYESAEPFRDRAAAEAARARLQAASEAADAVGEPEPPKLDDEDEGEPKPGEEPVAEMDHDDDEDEDEKKKRMAQERRATASGSLHPRDLTGRRWEIVVIQEGRSANGFNYPAEVLQRDAHVFEGSPLRVTWEQLDHHDTVGTVRSVEARKIDGKLAICGYAEVTDEVAQARLLKEYRRGDPLEFSIDAQVRASESRRGEWDVTAITSATEVTIVRRGAAGGRALRAVAAKKESAMSEAIKAELARARKAADQLERMQRVAESSAILDRELAASKLPAPALERVREALKDTPATAEQIQAAIKTEREYLGRVTASSHRVIGCGPAQVEVGVEPHDRMVAALEGYFSFADQPIRSREGKEIGGRVPRFKSLHRAVEEYAGRRLDKLEAFRLCAGGKTLAQRARESGCSEREMRARESIITSTFANVLVDTINKRMLLGYSMDDRLRQLRLIAGRNFGTSIPDFRAQTRYRYGGYGLLPTVAERGPYNPLTAPLDEKGTITVSKKGGTEDMTLETFAADDQRALAQIPDKLRLAAIETLYQAVFDMFANNTTTIDGRDIFDTGNETSNAFSKTELNVARQAMRSATPFGDTTKVLGLQNLPKILWGPNELEEAFAILSGSRVVVGATNQAATEEPNLHRGLNYEIIDYWTDAADSMVTADPMQTDTVEIGFFEGREEPELFVQDSPTVGSAFDVDAITWTIRHIWGVGVLDFRPFYGFSR
jgi:hypothetical protein